MPAFFLCVPISDPADQTKRARGYGFFDGPGPTAQRRGRSRLEAVIAAGHEKMAALERPFGTGCGPGGKPAMNCRPTFGCPAGTRAAIVAVPSPFPCPLSGEAARRLLRSSIRQEPEPARWCGDRLSVRINS